MVNRTCNTLNIKTPVVPSNPNANPLVADVAEIQRNSAKFKINNAKCYDSVISLSINDNIKFLET